MPGLCLSDAVLPPLANDGVYPGGPASLHANDVVEAQAVRAMGPLHLLAIRAPAHFANSTTM
jgi:hypothetical protein